VLPLMDATEPREMSSMHGLPQLSLLAIWILGPLCALYRTGTNKKESKGGKEGDT